MLTTLTPSTRVKFSDYLPGFFVLVNYCSAYLRMCSGKLIEIKQRIKKGQNLFSHFTLARGVREGHVVMSRFNRAAVIASQSRWLRS